MTQGNNAQLSVQRNSEAWKQYGISRTTYYSRIIQGLIPKPFSCGERATGQLAHETQAVISAMAAGQSKNEIKALVTSLIEQRKELQGVNHG